jgi:type IV pilus assembly protein PilE
MSTVAPAQPAAVVPARGFTLVEVLITVTVVAILAAIALPSYRDYIRRSSREAAQAELVELSAIQEKIFLNVSAYTSNVSAGYNGNTTGGLGASGGKTRDGKYTLSVAVSGASYTLTATPVTGSTQAGDGDLTINASGSRAWAGSKPW